MWMILALSMLFAQEFTISKAKEVEIVGPKVNLQITPASSRTLVWSCDKECEVKPENKAGKVVVRISSSAEVKLEIPSLPLYIYSNEANLRFTKWQNQIKGRFVKLVFQSQNGSGQVDLTSSLSDIQIANQAGKITLDLFDGNLVVSNTKGDITVSQFAGKQSFLNVDGNLQVSTQKTETLIKNGRGKLTYHSVKGRMGMAAFKGEIAGESLEGISQLILAPNSKVSWKANRGDVQLKVQKGMAIDVGTKDGKMQLMSPLRAITEGDWKVARVKESGSESGSVLVRTNRASIQLRSE
jgi:hypothetical protein